MKWLAILLLAAIAWVAMAWAAESHSAKGLVLKTDEAHQLLTVSCEAIPGYMDAMEMEFSVRDAKVLAGLTPGATVSFSIVPRGKKLYAEQIHPSTAASFEAEPMAAAQLTALNRMLEPASSVLNMGEPVPDFALTDQAGQVVHLAQWRGKVVLITFGYSRCPNPNYCYRLSNNLAQVEKRFHQDAGKDLILLTIMLDPEHDQGITLSEYASAYKANAASWHFLTGPLPEIKQVCGMFGTNFWSVEGLLTHSLHTAIVDRQGKLAVNLEGNQFSARELGDLARTVMSR